MNPLRPGTVLSLLIGATLLRLSLSGNHTRYVQPAMGPLLTLSGVVLLALSLISLVPAFGSQPTVAHDHDHDHDHDRGEHADAEHDDHGGHGHGPAIAWLLMLPVLAVFIVAPPTLGAWGLGRVGDVVKRTSGSNYLPLVKGSEPVSITVRDFVGRAYDADGSSFAGATVRLTGFVAPAIAPDTGLVVARYSIACCAADALAAQALLVDLPSDPPPDTWIEVDGTFVGLTQSGLPRIRVTDVRATSEPSKPYE